MPKLGDRRPYEGRETDLLLLGRDPGPDGTYHRGADGRLPRDPNDPTIWLPGQGPANACGTTTLAYVLRHLLGDGAPTRAGLDARVRRADIFTAPSLLVDEARRAGLAARAYNGADLDLVLGLVDRGIPVVVLTDTTPLDLEDTANLHWVALVGQDADVLALYNPHGFQEAVDTESFDGHWREARVLGLPAWRRLAIAVAPAGTALPGGGTSDLSRFGADWAATGAAGLVNAVASIRRDLAPRGTFARAMLAGAGALGLAGPAARFAVGAAALLAGALPTDPGSLGGVARSARALLSRPTNPVT